MSPESPIVPCVTSGKYFVEAHVQRPQGDSPGLAGDGGVPGDGVGGDGALPVLPLAPAAGGRGEGKASQTTGQIHHLIDVQIFYHVTPSLYSTGIQGGRGCGGNL